MEDIFSDPKKVVFSALALVTLFDFIIGFFMYKKTGKPVFLVLGFVVLFILAVLTALDVATYPF